MARTFSRSELLEQLGATVQSNAPIVAAGPCNGIAAKCAALGGADLIIYTTMGTSRSMGFATRIIEDFRGDRSVAMHTAFSEVIRDTPLIAGLDATDIWSLDHERFVDRFLQLGVSGVANLPSAQMYGDPFRRRAKNTRHGFEQELSLVSVAHARGLFTVGYVYYADDAEAMIDAGADMIVATCGLTQGGSKGYPEQSMESALEKVAPVIAAAKAKKSDVLCLGHGGPFNSPESTETLYAQTAADGIYGCSALDRIPIEIAVREVMKGYKAPISGIRGR